MTQMTQIKQLFHLHFLGQTINPNLTISTGSVNSIKQHIEQISIIPPFALSFSFPKIK